MPLKARAYLQKATAALRAALACRGTGIVAKNIDCAHVGDHKTNDGYTIVPDCVGGVALVPSG